MSFGAVSKEVASHQGSFARRSQTPTMPTPIGMVFRSATTPRSSIRPGFMGTLPKAIVLSQPAIWTCTSVLMRTTKSTPWLTSMSRKLTRRKPRSNRKNGTDAQLVDDGAHRAHEVVFPGVSRPQDPAFDECLNQDRNETIAQHHRADQHLPAIAPLSPIHWQHYRVAARNGLDRHLEKLFCKVHVQQSFVAQEPPDAISGALELDEPSVTGQMGQLHKLSGHTTHNR